MAQFKDDTILEAQRTKLKPPPMFKVMLLNDDYTPMEFVVVVLQKFFGMTRERATQVMLKVHKAPAPATVCNGTDVKAEGIARK